MRSAVFLIILLIILYGCRENDNVSLKGHWANTTLVQQIKDYLPGYSGDWIYSEIIFDGVDSALVRNGFESPYKVSFKKEDLGYVLEITPDRKDLNVYFILHEGRLVVVDPGSHNKIFPVVFTQVDTMVNEKDEFTAYLNRNVIAGEYILLQNNQPVRFTEKGDVIGLPGYRNYEICYSGDCMCEIDTYNVISLIRDSPETGFDYFAWERDTVEGRLLIYRLSPPVPDIKGERMVTGIQFELKEALKNGLTI